MTAYIRLFDKFYPLHEGDLRLADPNMGQEFVLPEGYAEIVHVDYPQYDRQIQTCVRGEPELRDGVWYVTWVVRDLTQEELNLKSNPPQKQRARIITQGQTET